jgi:hypothetical protein
LNVLVKTKFKFFLLFRLNSLCWQRGGLVQRRFRVIIFMILLRTHRPRYKAAATFRLTLNFYFLIFWHICVLMNLVCVHLWPVEILWIIIVKVGPGELSVILQIQMEFWIIEYTINSVIFYGLTVFSNGFPKRVDPANEGWSHQDWVCEVLAKNWVGGFEDPLLGSFVITFNFIFLFLDLKYIFKEFVIVFDLRGRKLDLVLNLHMFSGFNNPSFPLSRL